MSNIIFRALAVLALGGSALTMSAQGWPAAYNGVMLQGFYWDSFTDTQWSYLEKQSDELSRYFDLIWVPQSGNCNSNYNQMGYTPVYYFNHNSSFGSESQLRSMIQTFKQKGTGIIADVVINHRNNLGVGGSWVDYPAETYKGVTYQMLPTDICANDDNGQTKTWASQNGISLSSNNDTGEGWDGCRDLDHKSANVNKCVKVYLDYLLNDLGYAGFRYDMVKGYSASFTADYNSTAKPKFSVGECWDGTGTIQNWINGTKVNDIPTSAAFDFQFRYRVRDAINNSNWSTLGSQDMVINTPAMRQYAVTFVENHDTEYRSSTAQQDPIKKDTLAANAYLLMMPGTPCVFLKHWQAYKPEIKSMIEARKLAGISNQSTYLAIASNAKYYARYAQGTRCQLLCELGDTQSITLAGANATKYVEILSGYHYKYLLSKDAECAWISQANGEFTEPFKTKLVAVSQTDGAQIVYTLDGSDPTATNGTKVASGTELTISSSETLKAGLLVNGKVTDICTREYSFKAFAPHTATVYVQADWSPVYFYIWDSNNNTQLNGNWPGKVISDKKTIDGADWYYQTVSINKNDYYFNIIFNAGSGKPQTADITRVTEDKYYIAHNNGSNITYEDVTDQMTAGIQEVVVDEPAADAQVYDLQGRRLAHPSHGLYIQGGKVRYSK